jgi:hypothetical protein
MLPNCELAVVPMACMHAMHYCIAVKGFKNMEMIINTLKIPGCDAYAHARFVLWNEKNKGANCKLSRNFLRN